MTIPIRFTGRCGPRLARVYKLSASRLLQLKTDEQLLVAQKNQAGDFSTETPQTYSKLPERYNVDMGAWTPASSHLVGGV